MKIAYLLKERNWTLYRLAKESGVQNSNLKNICFCNRIPTIPTIIKICNGFGITLSEFFAEESCEPHPLTVSDQLLLTYFHNLTRENKKLTADYVHRLLQHVTNSTSQTQTADDAADRMSGLADKAAVDTMANDKSNR